MNSAHRNYAILFDSATRSILLSQTESGLSPFYADAETRHFWQSVSAANTNIGALLGRDVVTIRCLQYGYEQALKRTEPLYLMESKQPHAENTHAGVWVANVAVWITEKDLDNHPFAAPISREVLRDVFAWLDSDHDARVPWYRPGWFTPLSESLSAVLTEHGYTVQGAFEQLRSWGRSAITRANTDKGAVYIKSAPDMFAHEPKLAEWLGTHYPDYAAPVIAVTTNAYGHHLIMPDYGSTTLESSGEIEAWEDAARRYGDLQAAVSGRIEDLIALGVPDRREAWMHTALDRLLSDDTLTTIGNNPLTADEIARLHDCGNTLHEKIRALWAEKIPASVEHGDFWAGQVPVIDGVFRFADWSDASVSHPFFSLPFFLADMEIGAPPAVPQANERIIGAYLGAWQAFDTSLLELYSLAQQLSPLHHALGYYLHILPGMEFGWEMENMLVYNVREVLRLV
jgi:hypothetical protein